MKFKEYLKGKKIVFYGDSITHNWDKYTHDYELVHKEDPNYVYGLGQGYVKYLDDECHFKTVDNFAVSGGCYANCFDIHPGRPTWRHFPYQVMHSLDALKEAEVVLVFFGSNDYATQVKFGDFIDKANNENETDMTFYGGMNFGFDKIKEVNPNAKVVVINCLPRTCWLDEGYTFNYSLNEYNLAIAHECRVKGIQMIDVSKLYEIIDGKMINNGKVCSDDGLHPNATGHQVLAKRILEEEVK